MPSFSKLIPMALSCLLLTICLSASAKADSVVETYTGNTYTTIPVPSSGYTVVNSITATLTFANPLPADASLAYGGGVTIGTPTATDPLEALVMTDGKVTLNLSTADGISIFLVTGGSGQIVSWFVGICAVPCSSGLNIDTMFGLPAVGNTLGADGSSQASSGTLLAGNFGDPGVWTASAVPEPSSYLLLGIGLLGLLALAARSKRHLQAT